MTSNSFFMWPPSRIPVFWARFYLYSFFFNFHFRFTKGFGFYKPGLEMKYACEEAEKCGA